VLPLEMATLTFVSSEEWPEVRQTCEARPPWWVESAGFNELEAGWLEKLSSLGLIQGDRPGKSRLCPRRPAGGRVVLPGDRSVVSRRRDLPPAPRLESRPERVRSGRGQ
jgi:hypothetical protein